ncbi:MAG: type II toxin-antitoxin system VapC family toxin [Chloroflexi bacterium]|nr:type II toxin-antitoxin system VapC family toxin [Chloroflexota bacterium]
MIALDASALLAYLFKEVGHTQIDEYIDECCLSTVNLSEVIGRFARDGHDSQKVLKRILSTNIEVVSFTAAQAALAASLLPPTKPFGLSLADRACLSLALDRDIPVVTADQVWHQTNFGLQIIVIR